LIKLSKSLFLQVLHMEKITRFERARVISARALQLALGAPPLVKPSSESTPYELAKQELESKVLPLSVLRRFPDGKTVTVDLG
jgi:DNA-directed RNA polymerase subunit K/omega